MPTIQVECLTCGYSYRVAAELEGRRVKCPHCRQRCLVTALKEAKPEERDVSWVLPARRSGVTRERREQGDSDDGESEELRKPLHGRRGRFPVWAWIIIGVCGALYLCCVGIISLGRHFKSEGEKAQQAAMRAVAIRVTANDWCQELEDAMSDLNEHDGQLGGRLRAFLDKYDGNELADCKIVEVTGTIRSVVDARDERLMGYKGGWESAGWLVILESGTLRNTFNLPKAEWIEDNSKAGVGCFFKSYSDVREVRQGQVVTICGRYARSAGKHASIGVRECFFVK